MNNNKCLVVILKLLCFIELKHEIIQVPLFSLVLRTNTNYDLYYFFTLLQLVRLKNLEYYNDFLCLILYDIFIRFI